MAALGNKLTRLVNSLFDEKLIPYVLAGYFICRILRNSSMLPIQSVPFSMGLSVISKLITFYVYIRAAHVFYKYHNYILNWRSKDIVGKITAVLLMSFFVSLTISRFMHGIRTYIISVIALIAMCDVNTRKIVKISYKVQNLMLSLIVFLSSIGIATNYTVERSSSLIRSSLGFLYPSCAPQFFMFAILSWLFIKRYRVGLRSFFEIQLIASLLFFLTDSRTEFILTEFALIISLLHQAHLFDKWGDIKTVIFRVASLLLIISPFAYALISIIYNGDGIFAIIDGVLSSRIMLTHNAFQQYRVGLFGNNIKLVGGGYLDQTLNQGAEYNYIDSEYMQLLFQGGSIAFLLFLALLMLYLVELNKNREWCELLFALFCFSFGLINPRIFSLEYCPILFLAMYHWSGLLNNRESSVGNIRVCNY